jgi:hypothetical protein
VAVGDLKPDQLHNPKKDSKCRRCTFRQLIEYGNTTFNSGNWSFVVKFVITGDTARITCLNHEGFIYSDLVCWRTERYLADFFWSLAHFNATNAAWTQPSLLSLPIE